MLLDRFVEVGTAPAEPPGVRTPTPVDVDRLRSVVGGTLVTVTLVTEPSPGGMSADEAVRLAEVLAELERRLRLELPLRDALRLADRCRRLAVDVIDEPTGSGLALLVGGPVAEAYRLAVSPIERVVVDPTFATRDLERSVQAQPPAVVVMVGASGASAWSVDDRGATPWGEPVASTPPAHPAALHRWAREVSRAIDRAGAERRGPVVLVGPRVLREVVAGHAEVPLLASIEANGQVPGDELAALVRSVLESAHRRALAAGLARVDAASGAADVLRGVDAVWPAACAGEVELVVVDAAYAPAARVDATGRRVELVDDPSPPGVTDDLVDELVELTVLTGGQVLFGDPGCLGEHRVAAVARPGSGPAPVERLVGVA